jgi:hypothetical protein
MPNARLRRPRSGLSPFRCGLLLALLLGGLVAAVSLEAGSPRFEAATLDDSIDIGYAVTVGDVDGDQRPDLLLVDKTEVVWYRNPDWQRFVLCAGVTERDNVCIAACDIDYDGKVEVAIGAEWNPGDTENSGSVHYLVPPADRTQRWEVIDLPREPTVHRMRWMLTADGSFQLVVAPLHGRGNRRGEGAGVKVLAYTMPADPTQTWSTELVDDSLHILHNFEVVQWDADLERELLLAGKEGIFYLDRAAGAWQRRQLSGARPGAPDLPGASEIRDGRLPSGERFLAAVEPFHGSELAIYTPPRSAGESFWRRRVIETGFSDGHAVACADVLRLGSDQVVAGWRRPNADGKVGIKLYRPRDEAGAEWEEWLVDDDGMACEDLQVHDLDGDGRLDIVAAGRATKNLKVYWNRGWQE